MGVVLEGYSLAWDKLYEAIKAGEVGAALDAEFKALWLPDRDPGASWASGLDELQDAIDDPADDYYPDLSEAALLAFVACVRHLGELCGTLVHNSLAGERFRSEFLDGLAKTAFASDELPDWLIDRPFHSLGGSDFPTWGGLSRDEIGSLLERYRPPAGVSDPDMSGWLEELHEMLVNARRLERDLITLYA